MKTRKVIVLPYDPNWKTDFEAIQTEIAAAMGDLALAIEHVGSTSVPGMSGKPCIDIDVVISDRDALPAAIDRLAQIGYEHEGDLGIPDRHAFRYDGKTHLQKHHLYVCPQDSAELHRHLTFRDHLRTHPDDAARYSAIKAEAAHLYPDDIDSYIRHKSPCIEDIYRKCGLM